MKERKKESWFRKTIKVLGPGLVTGASDDDPSGIVTYSQAGAKYGLSMLWTALLTFPLMAAVQESCARIGLVTTKGLAGTLKDYYPKWILWLMVITSFPAIVLNIGADIAGIGEVSHLLLPGIPAVIFNIAVTIIIAVLIIKLPYRRFANILKYLCLFILLYLLVPFFSHPHIPAVLKHTFIPTIKNDKEFISMIVALLGTTISPYLFFWQATMEAEEVTQKDSTVVVNRKQLKEMKKDVDIGMLFSNLVMYFIILSTGTVLFNHHSGNIETVKDAAEALKPVAGNAGYALFALGVIGTGLLAIPVLSGCLSYIMAESFGWQKGMDKKFTEARWFYVIILVSLGAGLAIDYLGISAVDALYYTAVIYGLTAPVMIAVILHIGNNRKIMKQHTNKRMSNVLCGITFVLMAVAAIYMLYLQFAGGKK